MVDLSNFFTQDGMQTYKVGKHSNPNKTGNNMRASVCSMCVFVRACVGSLVDVQ